jgi:uncharacterized protein YaiL (DUF2058 family)
MSMSLREQLLAAGLGTKKQAKQAEQQQRQQARNKAAEDERQLAAQRAQAAKAARDQELNRQREIQAEKKARYAQIKQLIEQHRLPKLETDEYYNFIDRQKIRRMCVDAARLAQITSGAVVIVRCEGKYDVVPAEIAERIKERDERAVIAYKADESKPADDDPYKDFVVPDDLRW